MREAYELPTSDVWELKIIFKTREIYRSPFQICKVFEVEKIIIPQFTIKCVCEITITKKLALTLLIQNIFALNCSQFRTQICNCSHVL